MKTNKIKIFFSIISFCFLVTSCNNLLSELTQQKTYIQISTNLDNSNQRTVLPNFSVVKGQGYTWQLYNGGTLFQTWDDANGKSAYQNMCESKIEVDPGSYIFELMVKKEGEIILKSESQTETIEPNKKIELKFVLYPTTDNEAYGSVNFKLTFPNEKVSIVKAKLFKPDGDGKEVAVGNMQEVVISPEGSSSTANITVNNVPAGSYLLKVDLCYQVAAYSREETINTYTTIVQVAAGFCSETEVTLNSLTDYYTITYKVDNQEITTFRGESVKQTTFKKNSEVDLLIACNSINNQISIGWFYDPECMRPVKLNSDGKFTITENITLYSQWGSEVSGEVLRFGAIDTDNNTEGLLIYTETGLNYFRDIVNGTLTGNIIVSDNVVYRKGTPYPTVNAKLCSDIPLTETEWVPIGNSNHFYQGTFDGDGKCVTNLNIVTNDETDLGFFGCVQDATIMDLYVEGNIEATNDSEGAVGGIVGYAKSLDESVTISNCINNVQINSQSKYVGGILGDFYLGSGEIKIDSCVNIANLIAQYPSGILNTSGKSTITNCLNLGKLTSTSTSPNYSAGICMTYSVDCNVSYCINAGSIISDEQCYPILCYSHNTDGRNPTCINCFYDSDKIQNVPETSLGSRITSLELDTLPLDDGWYNGEVSDFQYPIPSTIQEAFENKSSCWGIIFEAANIEASSGYVPGAYYVNGDTGNDTYDGSSRTSPKRNLTNVINLLKGQNVRTIYIDGELTAESQGVTETSSKKTLVTINDTDFGESNKITLIGINDATINAQKYGKFIDTNLNFYMKMQNLTIKNGWNNSSSGAALWFYGSSLELDECVIKDCVCTCLTDPQKYTGIYMSVSGSVLKMTNTTCENSIYLSLTEATIGSNCTIGTNNNEATDGFITLDSSTLILDGENIVINKPIYINNQNARIELRSNFEPTGIIQIKINSDLVNGFTLFETPRANLLDLFELVDSDGFILTEEGKIEK